MRNLKKLFAVLLTVAMIASMMVPALAGSYEGEGTKLQQIGLVAGDTPEQLDLDREMKRIEAVAFVIRAAGKEKEALSMTDEEVAEILAGWKDANEFPNWPNDNARKYGAYAIKAGIVVGMSSTEKIFAPNSLVKGIDFLVLLLKSALGYSKVNVNPDSENYVVEVAIDSGILQAGQVVNYASKTALIRDDAIHILYSAVMGGVNADGDKLIDALIEAGAVDLDDAIDAGFVTGLSSVTAAAVGAKKIKVTFNTAVADTTKATIEIKRGVNIKPNVKSVKWAEDKKSAVVEFSTNLVTDDYQVTVTGLTEEPLTASFKVEAAKLTTIRFKNDYAIMSDNGADPPTEWYLKAVVVAENQYGEDMTSDLNNGASVTTTKGTFVNIVDGVITISSNIAGTFKVDEKVTIVVVKDGIIASQTLTIAQAAAIESIEFGELTTDDKDLQGKPINVTAMSKNAAKYYLPITVKDQYGNVLKASEISGLTITSSKNSIVTPKSIEDKEGVGTVLTFENAGNEYGTVVLMAYTLMGKSANKTITVIDDAKIDVVTIYAPETALKQGVETVIPLTVVDTYGEEVDLYDITFGAGGGDEITLNTNTKITAMGGTFGTKVDHVKKTKSLTFKPSASAKSVTLTVVTANNKVSTITFSVLDAPVIRSIKGMKSNFAAQLANDTGVSTKIAGKVIFLDQYGDEYDDSSDKYPKLGNSEVSKGQVYYTITAKTPDDKRVTTGDTVDIKPAAGKGAGSDVFEVKLYEKAASGPDKLLDTQEVTVTVVDLTKITTFVVDDLDMFYTGLASALKRSESADYAQQVEVYGMYNGKKVVVPQSIIEHVYSNELGGNLDPVTGAYTVPTSNAIDTKGEVKTGKISVLIDNGKDTFTVEKEITYSSAAPKAQSVVVKYDGKTVSAESLEVEKADLADGNDIVGGGSKASKLQIVAKDQYGVTITTGFSFVVTNNNTSVTSIDIDEDGVIDLSDDEFDDDDNGKTFKLNIFIDGIYKALTIYVK